MRTRLLSIVSAFPLLIGCASNRASLVDQMEYLERQTLLYTERDLLARQMIAERFMNLPPEKQSRFHLETMDLRKPAGTGCNMAEMARADVAHGNCNILMAGDTFIPWHTEEKMWKYISDNYHIDHFHFGHGGTEPAQFYKLVESYNKVVEQAIERKFQRSHRQIWEEAAQAVRGGATATEMPPGSRQ